MIWSVTFGPLSDVQGRLEIEAEPGTSRAAIKAAARRWANENGVPFGAGISIGIGEFSGGSTARVHV